MNRFAVVLLLALVTPVAAHADTTGGLSGKIVDYATGAPISGVSVVAVSPAERAVTRSDAHGRYLFLNLVPGVYTVSFINGEYEPASTPGIFVQAGTTSQENVKMVRALRTAIIDCFDCWYPLQPGVVADLYKIKRRNAPAFDVVDSYLPLILSVPGVQIGPGIRMVH